MNYGDEPYVRLYVSDTVSWKMLSWQAQTVLLHMLKGRFDRSGVFEHGGHTPSRGVTAVTGLPSEVTEPGVDELLATGTWKAADGCLVWPTFVPAQNTPRTPTSRKREERERNLAAKLLNDSGEVTPRDSVGQNVTERDTAGQSVTNCHYRTRAHDEPDPDPDPEAEAEADRADVAATDSVPVPSKPKPRKRATQVPADWKPDDRLVAWCRSKGLSDRQIASETEGFVDYWAGEGKTKVDWTATFRNRIRSALDKGRIVPGGATSTPDPAEAAKRDAERIQREADEMAAQQAKAAQWAPQGAERPNVRRLF